MTRTYKGIPHGVPGSSPLGGGGWVGRHLCKQVGIGVRVQKAIGTSGLPDGVRDKDTELTSHLPHRAAYLRLEFDVGYLCASCLCKAKVACSVCPVRGAGTFILVERNELRHDPPRLLGTTAANTY